MQEIKEREDFDPNDNIFTLIYIKPMFLVENYKWLSGAYDKKFITKWNSLLKELGDKYNDQLYLKFKTTGIHPGCLIKGKNLELAKKICKDIQVIFSDYKLIIAYGSGEVTFMCTDIHISNGPVFVNVGRNLGKKKKPGIYYIP